MQLTQKQLLQQLNPLVSSPQWSTLASYMELVIDQHRTSLEGATTIEEVRELQGRIKAMKSLIALPSTIHAMKHDK